MNVCNLILTCIVYITSKNVVHFYSINIQPYSIHAYIAEYQICNVLLHIHIFFFYKLPLLSINVFFCYLLTFAFHVSFECPTVPL